MKIDASDFWDMDIDSGNPPLTDEMVARAEQRLGVSLPTELIALLRVRNGGYTRGFVYPTTEPTSWAEDHVPLDELYGIGDGSGEPGLYDINTTAYMTEEWGLPPRQVLLAGDGHTWITLDYRSDAVPSVAWIDAELGEELQLAPTFAAFLAGLLPNDEVDDETGTIRKPA